MRFIVADRDGTKIKADYEIRFIVNGDLDNCPDREQLALCGFEKGGVCNLPGVRRVYVDIENTAPETLRQAIAKAMKALRGHKIRTIKMPRISAPAGQEGSNQAVEEIQSALAAIAEGFVLSTYAFDKYKTKAKPYGLEEVYLSVTGCDSVTAGAAINRGKALAEATNYVRDIVNEIPEIYTPAQMAADAESLAEAYFTIKTQVYDKPYLREKNMNAFLAVNQSSPNEPKLIHLSYRPSAESKGKVCFVGKGLTYDSGGLSLKPSSSMYTMKADKSGAAAVMGIVKAAAELNLPYEIHGVLGCTENMVGSGAYKPDDVITTASGVTVEVTNTDAEGRLVLCDCLHWAQEEVKPDVLIDMATLTGACVVGLGDYTSGVIGNDFDLQMDYKMKAGESGENYTVLEFNDHLRPLIDSKVADIRNAVTGGAGGGALTAGLFLDKFIQDEYKDKWLHLDIAGPAYVEGEWGYNPAGGSGIGVRGAIYWLMNTNYFGQ